MRGVADGRMRKVLGRVAVAEIQAIAIYDAECFWIRGPEHLALLERIRAEEVQHAGMISGWVEVPRWEVRLNRGVGWALGSALACLPWKTLCRVQAWAEEQASSIYSQAIRELESDAEMEGWPALLAGLREAALSETGHATEFRTHSRK